MHQCRHRCRRISLGIIVRWPRRHGNTVSFLIFLVVIRFSFFFYLPCPCIVFDGSLSSASCRFLTRSLFSAHSVYPFPPSSFSLRLLSHSLAVFLAASLRHHFSLSVALIRSFSLILISHSFYTDTTTGHALDRVNILPLPSWEPSLVGR